MKTYIRKNMFKFISCDDERKLDIRITLLIKLAKHFDEDNSFKRDTKRGTQLFLEEHFMQINNDTEKTSAELANEFIRQLKQFHYIEEEYEQQIEYYTLTPEGQDIINFLISMESDEDKLPEGCFATIYSILNNTDALITHPYTEILVPVYNNFYDLMNELKKIGSIIYQKVKDILSQDTEIKTLDELYFAIDELFGSKKWDIVTRLKKRDNVHQYKTSIKNNIENLESEININNMINEVIESDNAKDKDDAYNKVMDKLQYIKASLENYDRILTGVISRISKYNNAATTKVKIIKNTQTNLHGQLVALIQDAVKLIQGKESVLTLDDFNKMTNIYVKKSFDLDELLKSKFEIKEKVIVEEPKEEHNNNNRNVFEEILTSPEFSFENVNKEIVKLLNAKGELTPYNTSDVGIMLLCMATLYKDYKQREYNMETYDDVIIDVDRDINNFLITKRSENDE